MIFIKKYGDDKMNVKKKSDSLIDMAKESMGIGIVGTAGLGAMSTLGAYGAPYTTPVMKATSAGVGLAALGQTAKIGMNIVGQPTQKKKTGNNVIDNILG